MAWSAPRWAAASRRRRCAPSSSSSAWRRSSSCSPPDPEGPPARPRKCARSASAARCRRPRTVRPSICSWECASCGPCTEEMAGADPNRGGEPVARPRRTGGRPTGRRRQDRRADEP
ncbi:DUF1272 domain-containing protein [Kitasatospora purpeofusca]|uniref:DUF1272 domain-containing protein n=1 Tax=Kitasatospora purpeofusca TaxID=67352 RepID=UPI00368B54B4